MPLYQGIGWANRPVRDVILGLSRRRPYILNSLQTSHRCQHDAARTVYHDLEASVRSPVTQSPPINPSTPRRPELYDLNDRIGYSFEDLRYEAHVEQKPDPGRPRLIDEKENKNNYMLWAGILETRLRHDGLDGVLAVWRQMRRRRVRLPAYGENAEAVWLPLLRLGFAKHTELEEIWKYVSEQYQHSGFVWFPLYGHVMRHFLRETPEKCLEWQQRFKRMNLPKSGAALGLITAALSNQRSMTVFNTIYKDMPDRNIHDQIVLRLCRMDNMKQALSWHLFLVSIGDLPHNQQLLRRLASYAEKSGDRTALLELKKQINRLEDEDEGEGEAPNTFTDFESKSLSGEDINRLIDQARGVEPRQVSDQFAARAFATRAFSLDFILKTLSGFGWRTLGPLAMHEIGIRCDSLDTFRQKIKMAEDRDVVVGRSVFNSIMLYTSSQNDTAMFEDLITTDVHPDCFEDEELQVKLLTMYARGRQWVQFNRTMTVLTKIMKTGRLREIGNAWNSYVKELLRKEQLEEAQKTVEVMLKQHVQIYPSTISQSFFSFGWASRQAGKGPIKLLSNDVVRGLTNLWLAVLQQGGEVPTEAWNQVFNFYGSRGRMADLEALALHLMHHYSADTIIENDLGLHGNVQNKKDKRQKVRDIFFTKRLAAIVEWGFLTLSKPTGKGELQWARGLKIIKALQKQGLKVNSIAIRRACSKRLLILFGPHPTDARAHNERARDTAEEYGLTLQSMVEEINSNWGQPLFSVSVPGKDSGHALEQEVFGSILPRAVKRMARRSKALQI